MTDHARDVHDALAPRAFLHDDPEAYLAGVDDALAQHPRLGRDAKVRPAGESTAVDRPG